jgi:hypothetical protein
MAADTATTRPPGRSWHTRAPVGEPGCGRRNVRHSLEAGGAHRRVRMTAEHAGTPYQFARAIGSFQVSFLHVVLWRSHQRVAMGSSNGSYVPVAFHWSAAVCGVPRHRTWSAISAAGRAPSLMCPVGISSAASGFQIYGCRRRRHDHCCRATCAHDVGQGLRHGVVVPDEIIDCAPVLFTIIEIDTSHLIDVDHRGPQVQDDVVRIAFRAHVVSQHLGRGPERVETEVLNRVLPGAMKSSFTRTGDCPPRRVVSRVPEDDESHAVMARAAAAALRTCG